MKNLKNVVYTLMFSSLALVTWAQGPASNFTPKNPIADNLLTSENTVILLIDWQPDLIQTVQNIDQGIMMNNIEALVKTAALFDIPVIETTIGVEMAGSESTVPAVKKWVPKTVKNIDRVSLNAWQNRELVEAVRQTGRKKILITGLWTSGCPTYTALDALEEGYEVYVLADVMGDATTVAHEMAIQRMIQAGAIPFTWEGAGAEILRSYTHPKAMQGNQIKGGFVEIMKDHFYPFAGKY